MSLTVFDMLWNIFIAGTGLALISVATAQDPALPVVDLGYELHQASYFNVCHIPPSGLRVILVLQKINLLTMNRRLEASIIFRTLGMASLH